MKKLILVVAIAFALISSAIMAQGYDTENNYLGRRGSNRDISDRKTYQIELEQSLIEKETLLYEIHHRVKNNLTVVSSLLKLQANSMEDERLTAALMDSQNRVQSMSAIHETLY
ncbi:MAG: sensor histidine kinase, partial [Calditrichaeota bacterium]|nr:sensor histidine kinase [Calditrichota bacterium]